MKKRSKRLPEQLKALAIDFIGEAAGALEASRVLHLNLDPYGAEV